LASCSRSERELGDRRCAVAAELADFVLLVERELARPAAVATLG
jgi:hypothetical protein